MIWKPYHQESMSKAAMRKAETWGDWLCFEEDCLYSVALLDLPALLEGMNAAGMTITRTSCIKTASAYYADYLQQVGIEPDAEGASQYHAWKRADAMRAAHDPDLIVSASSAGADLTEVTTADGREHIVTASSYKLARFPLLLLSECIQTTPAHCPICGAAMIANRRVCSDKCLTELDREAVEA
jgi:hypothetical protein